MQPFRMKIKYAGTGVIVVISLLITGFKSDKISNREVSGETMEKINREIKTHCRINSVRVWF